jgi:hypothetical protein
VDEERKLSPKERLEFYKNRKVQKRREQKLASHHRNKTVNKFEYKSTKAAVKKRLYRAKRAETKEKETQRKRKYRKSLKGRNITSANSDVTEVLESVFKNRTSKHRALKKLKDALPHTPKKRSATLAAYLKNAKSPTTKILINADVISSPEEQNEKSTEKAVFRDLKTAIDSCKMKRSNDSISSMNVLVASVSGEEVTKRKCRKNLAKSLGLPARRITRGNRIRTTVLKSEKSCWTYTSRKTRSDALSDETKRLAYNFWLRPGISRPTGNKADIKRERLGPKTYTSHAIHILEKTQTEVFVEFICENPDIKICQRSFENCKPYFVRQARSKDRHTCCCRYHVEIKSAFKSCMDFRKKILHTSGNYTGKETPIFESIGDVMNATLCSNYELECLRRNCSKCGVHKLHLLPEETGNAEIEDTIKWERFEKVDIKVKGNKTIKKLLLVKKESKVSELFSHLLQLLKSFPLHQHRATWQHSQFQTLVASLPLYHCVCVHDFSENYRCSELKQLQSSYFQKTEVSIHVTIIHRHALPDIDGVESSEENPEIITEHFFVISNDQRHDQYFVHEVRKSISEYLSSISYPVETMHEFTDGCAAQYKSRHCFGDIGNSCQDFGFKHFTRNYFETAHAKG